MPNSFVIGRQCNRISPPRPAAPPSYQETLAAVRHLTERRVQQFARDEIIPKGDCGESPLRECVSAYVGDLQSKLGQGGKIVDIREAKRRLKTAQAELKERELDVLDRRLIAAHEVERVWGEITHQVRSAFMSLADDASAGLHDSETIPEKREYIAELVEAALSSISEAEGEVEEDPTSGRSGSRSSRSSSASSAEAASKAHRYRMG